MSTDKQINSGKIFTLGQLPPLMTFKITDGLLLQIRQLLIRSLLHAQCFVWHPAHLHIGGPAFLSTEEREENSKEQTR
jgi:hypothetical protein